MIATTNRRAVTLVEVLIAIFLMGIGLMAILSLFPLGAAQMAQALQDQRAAEAATNAAAFARTIWKETCDADPNNAQAKFLAFTPNGTTGSWSPQSAPQQPFVLAMDSPNSGLNASTQISSMQSLVGSTGASYPVLVDPIGWLTNAAISPSFQSWVGYSGGTTPCIPRRSMSVPSGGSWVSLSNMGTLLPMLKQFSLMDDMSFNFNGTPDLDSDASTSDSTLATSNIPPAVRRQGRYSWAFLFRRTNNTDRTAADITTILYSGRSLDVASTETAYSAVVDFPAVAPGIAPLSKSLTISYVTGAKPAIRRGGWILDATMVDGSNNIAPQGIFYRVVNVDDSTPNALAVELQSPIVGKTQPAIQTTQRTIVVMDKVVEVFTKKDVSNVAPAMPY